MILYRVLLVLGALLIILEATPVLLNVITRSASPEPIVGGLLILAPSVAILLCGRSLARRGRARSASLVLAVLVIPGVLVLSSVGYVLFVSSGSRH